MELIKKKFLVIDIESQIHFGVISVTFCIWLLVFSLLSIYSFVMINLSYVEVISLVEEIEDNSMANTLFFVDSTFLTSTEMTKFYIQWFRNFITHSANFPHDYRNDEYILAHFQHNGTQTTFCETNLCFNVYDYSNSIGSAMLYNITTNLFFSFIYLKRMQMINNGLFNLSETMRDFTYYVKQYNISFSINFGNGMNEFEINEAVRLSNENIASSLNNYVDISNYFPMNIGNNLTKVKIAKENPIWLIQKSEVVNDKVISMSYNSQNVLHDVVMLELNRKMLDEVAKVVQQKFNGVKILFSHFNSDTHKDELFPVGNGCQYFYYLPDMNNKINIPPIINKFSYVEDCFERTSGYQLIKQLSQSQQWIQQNYKRKYKIPMTPSILDDSSVINFKIFKYNFPDPYSLYLSNPLFLNTNFNTVYLFKNSNRTEYLLKLIFFRFLATMFTIIIGSNIIWGIVIITVVILVSQVSRKLTVPIRNLISWVQKMGKQNENELHPVYIDELKYEEDEDINKLFSICKDLIKGGFSTMNKQQESKALKGDFDKSRSKYGNMLINEDQIESEFAKTAKNLFNFKPTLTRLEKDLTKDEMINFICENNSSQEEEEVENKTNEIFTMESKFDSNERTKLTRSELSFAGREDSPVNVYKHRKSKIKSFLKMQTSIRNLNENDFIALAGDHANRENYLFRTFNQMRIEKKLPPKI